MLHRNLRGEGWKSERSTNKYTKFGQLIIGKIIYCHQNDQMSHFKAKMHQILFPASVRLSVRHYPPKRRMNERKLSLIPDSQQSYLASQVISQTLSFPMHVPFKRSRCSNSTSSAFWRRLLHQGRINKWEGMGLCSEKIVGPSHRIKMKG